MITKGFTDSTIMTKGFAGGLFEGMIRDVLEFKSYIITLIFMRSKI